MTTPKPQKDKIWLTPRPTAASAARAARNATNRNLTTTPVQRQSPNRPPVSPTMKKRNPSNQQRSLSRTESKIDTKANLKSESALFENSVDNHSDQMDDRAAEREDGTATPENETTDQFESVSSEDPKNVESEIVEVMEFHAATPVVSRPQTPKSSSSRPMTPRGASRPVTPVPPVQRPGTPCSRPTTPQARPQPSPNKQTPPARPQTPTPPNPIQARPRTPSNLPVPTARIQQNSNAPASDGDIKSTFSAKQRQFQMMKKELDLKQQAVLEVFDSLRNLRERMAREGLTGGGEGTVPQDLVVFNVADWTADEVAQLCRDAASSSNTDGAVEFFESVPDECALDELDAKVLDIPAQFADLCLQAFSARQELIDWVKDLVTTNSQEDGRGETMQRIARYNARGLEMCEALRELKSRSDDAVDAIANVSKRVCREQTALIAVGKSLVREVARLSQDLDSRACMIEEMRHLRAESDVSKELEDTRQELEEEKSARLAMKDKLSTTEHQLRQTRLRVTKMDRQLREAEASISSLTGTVKSLEDQSRQREVQLEARARKLKESLKTGEVASGQLAQHRDALQSEVLDLKEQIERMTTEHKSAISNLNAQLKDLKSSLEEQHQITQKELDLKIATEAALADAQTTIEDLKVKITELENSKPNPELPTEREMDLWAELQATKETLRTTEDEVTACKREKVRFLETLTKIAESENKVGLQQKLAAELLNKEEIIGKMQIQMRDLTKNIKLNEQKVIQYESYVRDLQAHNRAVANCQEAPDGISYQDLQQEIMNLRMGLLESVHRNEELSEVLAQKEQQLEQQDKTSRAQARVIKVREELINMLKNKETEQSRELTALQQNLEHRMKIVDEVNKQIAAKAEEIQELFSTLENKQQQIHRLEKIVLALEEQQRRAQAQRTRHEEKIAALEHELAAGGNRRERKFLFF